jgi:hypothetical protein
MLDGRMESYEYEHDEIGLDCHDEKRCVGEGTPTRREEDEPPS